MPSSFVNRIRVIAYFNALPSESRGPHLHTCSHDLKRRSNLSSFSLWTWRVRRLQTCPTGSLASRARSRAALLLVSFPSQGGFELCFLARWHEERVFLSVLDYLFGHYLPLEPPQSALNGFTRVNIHYCHLFLQSCFSLSPVALFEPILNMRLSIRVKRAWKTPRTVLIIRGAHRCRCKPFRP